jgi:hypothetical protein
VQQLLKMIAMLPEKWRVKGKMVKKKDAVWNGQD